MEAGAPCPGREPALFILGERRLRGVPSDSLQIPMGALRGERSQALHRGAWWEGKTQQAGSFTLGIKKNFFTPRTIKQWIDFPERLCSLHPCGFSRPGSNPVCIIAGCPLSRSLDLTPPDVPSNLNYPLSTVCQCNVQIGWTKLHFYSTL